MITDFVKIKKHVENLENNHKVLYNTLATSLEEITRLKLENEALKRKVILSKAVELAFKFDFEMVSNHRKHGIYVLASNSDDFIQWYIEQKEGK